MFFYYGYGCMASRPYLMWCTTPRPMLRLLMLSGTRWMPSMPTSSPRCAFSVSCGVGPVKSTVTIMCSGSAIFYLSGLCMLFGLDVRLL